MKKLIIILLSISILIVISCENPTPPDDNDEEIILSEETVVIDETNLSEPDIDSTGTFYSYTFTGNPPDINVNDVIIGQTDYGYLRRVTNVAINGNEIVLQTEQACLTDAIKECAIKDSIKLTIGKESKFNGMYCTYLAKGVTVERGGINLDNTTLYSGNVGNVTFSATIPEGYVSFEPLLKKDLEIGLKPHRVEHFLFSAGGMLEYDCDLQITTSASIDYGKQILLATFISPPFPIGPVSCFIELSFVAGFDTQLDVEGTIKSGFDSEASVEFGAEYNYSIGWNDIWNKSFEFNDHPIEWGMTGDVYAKGYITPQITLKIAGVLGPYMEVEPYLKFDGNVTIPTSWEWEFLGGVDGNLGFEVEILSFSLVDYYKTLLNWETTIASDNGLLDYITVTSPNGGETWQMGTSYNITWNDNISSNVKIDLYKSGTYNREIKDSTPSNGSYSWSIPTDLTESSNYKVKIISTSNSSVNDQSNNYFTIEEESSADYITVTSPNGGETWQMGTTYNITWSDNISSNVKIELYKSGTYNRLIKDSTPSNGSYTWSIPTDLTESSSYKVKITSTSNSSVNDFSNNYFTIEEQPPADYITVTSPNGGETWQIGTSYTITWSDNITSNVKIDLYKSGTYNRLIKDSTPSNGSYSWSIPTDLTESSSYKVKITSTSNSSVNDYSNNYFTIEEEPPADYITVTSPNGGETWQMGTSYTITWSDNITSNVKIDLYKSGTYNRLIKDSTPSNGSYTWSIPTDLTESSNYKVKIISTSNSSVNDQSDSYFEIFESSGVQAQISANIIPNTIYVGVTTNATWKITESNGVGVSMNYMSLQRSDDFTEYTGDEAISWYNEWFGTNIINPNGSIDASDNCIPSKPDTHLWTFGGTDDNGNYVSCSAQMVIEGDPIMITSASGTVSNLELIPGTTNYYYGDVSINATISNYSYAEEVKVFIGTSFYTMTHTGNGNYSYDGIHIMIIKDSIGGQYEAFVELYFQGYVIDLENIDIF